CCCCICVFSTVSSFFFFSSRRRHTRFSRDWSSDVCSSDLFLVVGARFDMNDHPFFRMVSYLINGCLYRRKVTRSILRYRQFKSRSEERRVGKECRSRRSPQHEEERGHEGRARDAKRKNTRP